MPLEYHTVDNDASKAYQAGYDTEYILEAETVYSPSGVAILLLVVCG